MSTRLREEELAGMATVYRDMARRARDVRLAIEFMDRAERYETAVWAVKR
jgi:hypothetical protein